jgi:hypothetical protein
MNYKLNMQVRKAKDGVAVKALLSWGHVATWSSENTALQWDMKFQIYLRLKFILVQVWQPGEVGYGRLPFG